MDSNSRLGLSLDGPELSNEAAFWVNSSQEIGPLETSRARV